VVPRLPSRTLTSFLSSGCQAACGCTRFNSGCARTLATAFSTGVVRLAAMDTTKRTRGASTAERRTGAAMAGAPSREVVVQQKVRCRRIMAWPACIAAGDGWSVRALTAPQHGANWGPAVMGVHTMRRGPEAITVSLRSTSLRAYAVAAIVRAALAAPCEGPRNDKAVGGGCWICVVTGCLRKVTGGKDAR
jgi:hypothetical protein